MKLYVQPEISILHKPTHQCLWCRKRQSGEAAWRHPPPLSRWCVSAPKQAAAFLQGQKSAMADMGWEVNPDKIVHERWWWRGEKEELWTHFPYRSRWLVLQISKLSLFFSKTKTKMKVDFAPLDVPLHRRVQTAAVLQWVFSFLGLGKYQDFSAGWVTHPKRYSLNDPFELMLKHVCSADVLEVYKWEVKNVQNVSRRVFYMLKFVCSWRNFAIVSVHFWRMCWKSCEFQLPELSMNGFSLLLETVAVGLAASTSITLGYMPF